MPEKTTIKDILKPLLVPIHPEAKPFVTLFAIITLGLFLISTTLGYIGIILTIWCLLFFRDPTRITPQIHNAIISPADGTIQKITTATPPEEIATNKKPMTRISIFMNVFNVHINRIPINGTITDTQYKPGKFLSADLDKASDHNERQSIAIKTADGDEIIIVQIAGLIARRIICNLQADDSVEAGEKFGLIRFGSRVDIYLPDNFQPTCAEGQTAIAGETIIASQPSPEAEPFSATVKNFIKPSKPSPQNE